MKSNQSAEQLLKLRKNITSLAALLFAIVLVSRYFLQPEKVTASYIVLLIVSAIGFIFGVHYFINKKINEQ